ncbi:hypothetical protein EMCRGX_G026375 [Ephydatia muelleri]
MLTKTVGVAACTMADIDKPLLAFLNGLAKRIYFSESDITDEVLRNEVLNGMPEEEYSALLKRYQLLLNNLVTADMDFTQLDAFLTSQVKKRQGAISEKEAATVTRFWRNQKAKIHQRLVEQSTWDNKVKAISWRVDVKTKSKETEQLNQASAIVEMQLGTDQNTNPNEVVRFELDSKKLAELLAQVTEVEKAVELYSHTSYFRLCAGYLNNGIDVCIVYRTDDIPLQLLSSPVMVYIGQAMVAIGTILVLSSTWRLGFFGTFMGDHFGLLLKERVTGFPFNVTENPMYWGSAIIYFGYSLQHASLVGFLLSLCITLSYAIAIRIEEPFTAMIYENAACSHSD